MSKHPLCLFFGYLFRFMLKPTSHGTSLSPIPYPYPSQNVFHQSFPESLLPCDLSPDTLCSRMNASTPFMFQSFPHPLAPEGVDESGRWE